MFGVYAPGQMYPAQAPDINPADIPAAVTGDIVTTSNAYFSRVVTMSSAEMRRSITASVAQVRRTLTTSDGER